MTIDPSTLFYGLPDTLRGELFEEYQQLVNHFYEGKWRPAELHAGRFCEVVYSIIAGRVAGSYPVTASKPKNFEQACKILENAVGLERGLRILAARILPALYEVRNNRDVGHVGGEVNPNYMDSSFSLAAASWLMSELVRVLHSTNVETAKRAVESLMQVRTPAVWVDEEIRRVLKPSLTLKNQILLLVASAESKVNIHQIAEWSEIANRTYLKKVIADLHKARFLEAADPARSIKLLPAGASAVQKLLSS